MPLWLQPASQYQHTKKTANNLKICYKSLAHWLSIFAHLWALKYHPVKVWIPHCEFQTTGYQFCLALLSCSEPSAVCSQKLLGWELRHSAFWILLSLLALLILHFLWLFLRSKITPNNRLLKKNKLLCSPLFVSHIELARNKISQPSYPCGRMDSDTSQRQRWHMIVIPSLSLQAQPGSNRVSLERADKDGLAISVLKSR